MKAGGGGSEAELKYKYVYASLVYEASVIHILICCIAFPIK